MKIIFFILLTFTTLFSDVLKENFLILDLNNSTPKIILDFESDNLEQFIELDTNENGLVSWKEIKAKKDEIVNFVLPHLKISSDTTTCKKKLTDFEVHRRVHQSYIKLHIDLDCPIPKHETKVFYDLFFDVDRGQKAFISTNDTNSSQPMMLSSQTKEISLKIKQASTWETFVSFLKEGIWHIWIGFDHILFLLMLLVSSVIYHKNREILPQNSLKTTLIEVLKIVTAFSMAHSITLALSVLEVVDVNMVFIEVAIALSVLFTALNNMFAFFKTKIWMLAFGFGLIHGFGFANVLKEMVLTTKELAASLLGFNLGVEIGQLAIVIAVVPILYFSRKGKFYRYVILYGFSALTAVVASVWAYERYANLSILPF
jgi:hypothetical protein